MSKVRRVYVEKKPEFAVRAKELKHEIKHYLGVTSIEAVRVLIRYDVENISEETYKKFVEEFSKFGSSAAAPQTPQPNQPSADTSNATANATPQAQAVVANNESVAYTKDFGELLMERLQNEKMMNRYRGFLAEDYDRSVSRL